jgi:DNA-binding NtrC family response regulator
MVVDDELDVLYVAQRILEHCGFKVDVFSSPVKAFAEFEDDPSAYSLILIDIRMPEMTGLELAKHLIGVKPNVQIIIMTAYEVLREDFSSVLPSLRWEDILRKPLNSNELCGIIRHHILAVREGLEHEYEHNTPEFASQN